MPVSPQDFALWSRMTGNPYPQTPAERMALAPEVYNYTRQIGRGGFNPIGETWRNIGKLALAGGLLAGAAVLGGKYLGSKKAAPKEKGQLLLPISPNQLLLPPSPDISESLEGESEPQGPTGPAGPAAPQAAASEPVEVSRPSLAKNFLRHAVAQQSLGGSYRSELDLELDNEPDIGSTVAESMPDVTSQTSTASGDITPPTTSDYYGQDVVSNQTSDVQALRGTTAQKPTLGPIEQKPATQSEVIGSQQHFSPGTEEQQLASSAQPSSSVREQAEELIGRVSAAKLAKFRQSPSYQATVKPIEAEELIGDDTPFVQPLQQPVTVPGPVSLTPKTRVVTTAVEEESPIAEMSTAATPVTVTSPAPAQKIAVPVGGASSSEIRELDQLLARSHARHTPEQRIDLRNQLLAKKYGGGEATVEAPAQIPTAPIITTSQPQPVRVAAAVSAPEAKISPNEFLSAMSQQVGPVATYDIPADKSKAVRGLAFYPGGEIGVKMPTKAGTVEYAYQSTDPYRLAMGDYAEEGFPATMGPLGGLLGAQGSGRKIGLRILEPGGTVASQQPEYLGLMPQQEIAKKLKSKVADTREQAQQHAETKIMLQNFASKYPQPPMSAEEKDRLRAERTPATVAKYLAGVV